MNYTIQQLKEELDKRRTGLDKHASPQVALRTTDNNVYHGQLREVSVAAGSILVFCGRGEEYAIAHEKIKVLEFLEPDPRWATTAKAA